MMRARVNGNYSAVTGACMMVDRKAFQQVGASARTLWWP